jgi:Lar family restriction alleviation protein
MEDHEPIKIEKKDFKPCPFCGSDELSIELRGVWKDNDCYCGKCGASIRCCDSPKELIGRWNLRTNFGGEQQLQPDNLPEDGDSDYYDDHGTGK